MLYIKADKHVWQFVGTVEVWSRRRNAPVRVARLVRPCCVCQTLFEVTQVLPTRTRNRAEELLADPPRGVRGVSVRQWGGRPPEKDVTLKVPLRGVLGVKTCPRHRGQAHLAPPAPPRLPTPEELV